MIDREIHEIDATGIPLGRLATRVACLLVGKHKASYLPHVDGGDAVKIVNVSKIKVTGKKPEQKIYRRHTMYPGNMKERQMKTVIKDDPAKILKIAVDRMLPKNRHRKLYMLRLQIS